MRSQEPLILTSSSFVATHKEYEFLGAMGVESAAPSENAEVTEHISAQKGRDYHDSEGGIGGLKP